MLDEEMEPMAEKILTLSVDIVYLLTKENYTIVHKKTSGKLATPSPGSCASVQVNKTQNSVMEPKPQPLIDERNNDLKILELTNKIINLLTGEVWKHLEDHRDMCSKDMMMETPRPLTTLDLVDNSTSVYTSTTMKEDSCERRNLTTPISCSLTDHLQNTFTHIMKEPNSHEDENSLHAEMNMDHTQSKFIHIKEESLSCEEENLSDSDICTYTDHTDCISTHILEESLSCEGGNLYHTDSYTPIDHTQYSSTHIKGEPVSCEENNLTHTDICTPADHAQYISNYIVESTVCEENPTHNNIYIDHTPNTSHSITYTTNNTMIAASENFNQGGETYFCTECGKGFPFRSQLDIHFRTHTGDRPHSCAVCNKCFRHKPHLIRHQRVHTGEKPYSCSECGKCFASNSDRVRHQKIHTRKKPFHCSNCRRSFTCISALVNHECNHKREKQFACLECGKRFSRKAYLQIHSRIHTGEKPYSCSLCGRCFNQKSALTTHYKTHRAGQLHNTQYKVLSVQNTN